jgi:hypothetical protein
MFLPNAGVYLQVHTASQPKTIDIVTVTRISNLTFMVTDDGGGNFAFLMVFLFPFLFYFVCIWFSFSCYFCLFVSVFFPLCLSYVGFTFFLRIVACPSPGIVLFSFSYHEFLFWPSL